MTRETKIGLLVGLAFIIVIGILLSDHFTSTMQPPPALVGAAESVLKGAATPGGGMANSGHVRVGEVKPDRVVDLSTKNAKDAVITVGPSTRLNTAEAETVPGNLFGNSGNVLGNAGNVLGNPGSISTGDSNLLDNSSAGMISTPVTPADLTGTGDHEQLSMEGQSAGMKEYTAEPGDTLSKIAAKALGKNTKTNRDAIIKVNPSLQKDPNRIKAGETYFIPTAGIDATAHVSTESSSLVGQTTRPAGNELVYTTKSGDSLWKIAVEQVGSPSAVAQIRELNKDVLKNGVALKPNMKLRLPPKTVASAN